MSYIRLWKSYICTDISVLCDLSSSLFNVQAKLYSWLEQSMIAYTKKKRKLLWPISSLIVLVNAKVDSRNLSRSTNDVQQHFWMKNMFQLSHRCKAMWMETGELDDLYSPFQQSQWLPLSVLSSYIFLSLNPFPNYLSVYLHSLVYVYLSCKD